MGQIAACLTDLICLIEQRDAFGFTSPSKAADSASVKKKREGRERERETPPRHFHSDRRPFAHTRTASGGLYLLALNFFFAAARTLSGHRPPTMAGSLENLSTVAVIDQERNSADDWSPLEPAVGLLWPWK